MWNKFYLQRPKMDSFSESLKGMNSLYFLTHRTMVFSLPGAHGEWSGAAAHQATEALTYCSWVLPPTAGRAAHSLPSPNTRLL